MDDDARLERFFADLAEAGPSAPVSAVEAGELLDLARVVAHQVERRFAPVAAYAAGLALTANQPAEDRASRIRQVREAAERLAADHARASDG